MSTPIQTANLSPIDARRIGQMVWMNEGGESRWLPGWQVRVGRHQE